MTVASFGALRSPRNILFGRGQRKALGKAARSLGARAPQDKIAYAAEQALTAQRLVHNNPKPLDGAALTQIITAAFHGRLLSAA